MTQKERARQVRRVLGEVREILMEHWDPIGVRDEPGAQDEYDSYAPVVLRLILDGSSALQIAEHLHQVEREQMGLGGRPLDVLLKVGLRLEALRAELAPG